MGHTKGHGMMEEGAVNIGSKFQQEQHQTRAWEEEGSERMM
jgi:hypothetical protein